MCTLILLWRAVDGHDLVLGMNRDESASRPADPPSFIDGVPPIVAPRDRKAGGTWIGASGTGLIAALSNRRGRDSATALSRGLLVLDALKQSSIAAVDLLLRREVAAREYNFWNLLVANRNEVRVFRYDGEISVGRGREGVNVLTNEGANVDSDPKVPTIAQLLAKAPFRSIEDAARTLQSTLRHHGGGETAALCLHAMGGGTVSSTILALNNADPSENILLYSDGSPCSAPYRDYGDVLRRLPSPR